MTFWPHQCCFSPQSFSDSPTTWNLHLRKSEPSPSGQITLIS